MARKPGTKPRGPRKAVTVRPPEDHYEVYAQRAAELGLEVGTYVAMCMARSHGLGDQWWWLPKNQSQRALLSA